MADDDETSWTLADVSTPESDEEPCSSPPRRFDDSVYPAAYAVIAAAALAYAVLGMRRSST